MRSPAGLQQAHRRRPGQEDDRERQPPFGHDLQVGVVREHVAPGELDRDRQIGADPHPEQWREEDERDRGAPGGRALRAVAGDRGVEADQQRRDAVQRRDVVGELRERAAEPRARRDQQHHHPDAERAHRGESPSGPGLRVLAERGAQAGQNSLGFGVAKTGVEFDHADAAGGSCQTAVEHAHKGCAAAGHFINGGLSYALNDIFDETFR